MGDEPMLLTKIVALALFWASAARDCPRSRPPTSTSEIPTSSGIRFPSGRPGRDASALSFHADGGTADGVSGHP